MKKNTKILIAAVLVLVLAASMLGIYLATRPDPVQGGKKITVEVVHGDGREVEFNYRTDCAYLGEVLLAEGLVKGEQGEYGLYITNVDGENAIYEENGAYWALYCNGEYATTGADTTPLHDGDVFRLAYTK